MANTPVSCWSVPWFPACTAGMQSKPLEKSLEKHRVCGVTWPDSFIPASLQTQEPRTWPCCWCLRSPGRHRDVAAFRDLQPVPNFSTTDPLISPGAAQDGGDCLLLLTPRWGFAPQRWKPLPSSGSSVPPNQASQLPLGPKERKRHFQELLHLLLKSSAGSRLWRVLGFPGSAVRGSSRDRGVGVPNAGDTRGRQGGVKPALAACSQRCQNPVPKYSCSTKK